MYNNLGKPKALNKPKLDLSAILQLVITSIIQSLNIGIFQRNTENKQHFFSDFLFLLTTVLVFILSIYFILNFGVFFNFLANLN